MRKTKRTRKQEKNIAIFKEYRYITYNYTLLTIISQTCTYTLGDQCTDVQNGNREEQGGREGPFHRLFRNDEDLGRKGVKIEGRQSLG